MSYPLAIVMLVEQALASGMKIHEITDPMIDCIGRAVVLGVNRESDPASRRAARDGMVEILRNDLDEAVARHDKLNPA